MKKLIEVKEQIINKELREMPKINLQKVKQKSQLYISN